MILIAAQAAAMRLYGAITTNILTPVPMRNITRNPGARLTHTDTKGYSDMSHKTERARRPVMSKLYTDIMNKKANSDATLTLRREIFRLARIRDILGLILIFFGIAIIALSVLLFRH
jgi:hypothetical protein